MRVQKKMSIKGDWAKIGEDVKDGDIVTVLDEGKSVEGDYGERIVFGIKTGNGERLLSFNQTTMNNLIDAFSEETKMVTPNKMQER